MSSSSIYLPVSGSEQILESEIVTRKRAKSTVPSNPLEMIAVGRECLTHWIDSGIDIKWISAAEFGEKLTVLESAYTARKQTGISRNPLTRRLNELDEIIDSKLRFVKDYIAEYYSNNPTPPEEFYRDFGIEKHEHQGYKIPNAREMRAEALKTMMRAMTDHGFIERMYGTVFWTPIYEEYIELFSQTYTADSQTKYSVKEKDEAKKTVYKALKALTLMLQAVYPDTFRDMFRIWGFQREKY